jgi:hypothetical protein
MYQIYYDRTNLNIIVNNSGKTIESINIAENNRGTTKYMEPQHQYDTFIDRKQCSLSSSKGKPLAEKIFITLILKTSFLIPPTLIYTNSIF